MPQLHFSEVSAMISEVVFCEDRVCVATMIASNRMDIVPVRRKCVFGAYQSPAQGVFIVTQSERL